MNNITVVHENLEFLADSQFRAAQLCCTSCLRYHICWPYLRLAGAVGGVESDEPFISPLLTSLLRNGVRDVLVAGSADSGVLALLHRACLQAGNSPRVEVIDRCITPLIACMSYANQNGINLRCHQGDLKRLDLHEHMDFIFGHSVIPFIESTQRHEVLASLARALRPAGKLVLTVRVAAASEKTCTYKTPDDKADLALKTLRSKSILLPCTEAAMHVLISDFFMNNSYQVTKFEKLEELHSDLRTVGFVVNPPLKLGAGNEYIPHSNLTRQASGWAYVASLN